MSWLMRESSRATREVSSNGIVRRMVNLPRSIVGGFSRVMSHGIGRIGIAGRRDQNPIPNFPLQPLQDHLNAPEEWTFLSVYEQQYGSTHPLFYACQFMEALKIAEDEHKFMFMYLHSPQHPFTPSFCWGTLGSELVVQFLDANFVCWGALSDRGEGSQMAVTLQPASFPCCAVIAPAAGNSIAVLQQVGWNLKLDLCPAIFRELMKNKNLYPQYQMKYIATGTKIPQFYCYYFLNCIFVIHDLGLN